MEILIDGYIVSTVIAIVAILNETGVKSQYKPYIAIAIGICIGLLKYGLSGHIVLIGLGSALTAMGVWSGSKTMTKSRMKNIVLEK